MPKVIKIEPRDVHVTVDFALEELRMLRDIISNVEVKYDGTDEWAKKGAAFFGEFYDFLYDFLKEVDKDGP